MSINTTLPNHGMREVAMVPTYPVWRLSVDQYHAMIREGILTDDDPVELLEGWLVAKMSKNPPHTVVTGLIRDALERLAPAGWFVNTQEPVTLDDSEPEPDIAMVRGERRDYLDHHPGPQDLALVVEVADASLQQDRGAKKRLYASARMPVYWIVNLAERQIEVYTDPSGPAEQADYRQRRDYKGSDAIPVTMEGREQGRLAVADLLP